LFKSTSHSCSIVIDLYYTGDFCRSECQCDSTGTLSGTRACSRDGSCTCKSGRYGDRCDQTCSTGCERL